MKKLMTSLLAVLLCGFSLCWAEGYKVSGSIVKEGGGNQFYWDDKSITLTPASGDAITGEAKFNSGEIFTYTFEFTDIADGEYTLTFKGTSSSIKYSATQTVTVNGADVTDITLNPTQIQTGDMTVEVLENREQYPFPIIANASVTYKEKGASGDGTTVSTQSNGKVTFEVDFSKQYSITVTASGYQSVSLEDVQGQSYKEIKMNAIPVTLSGTLKLGELTALPEGMGLSIVVGGNTAYTPTIGENGYSVVCKAGAAKVYVTDQSVANSTNVGEGSFSIPLKLAANYTVTTPENGSFTVTAGTDNTATQNIVLNKTAAAVFGTTSVQLSDNGLTLTKQGETEAAYTATYAYQSINFRFNAVEAGTYTLGCKEFGYQLKGTAPTVTVTNDFADVDLGAVEVEAVEAEYEFTGSFIDYPAPSYNATPIVGVTLKLYPLDQTEGEALATATTGDDGKYTLKTNAKVGDKFTVTMEGAGLFPQQTTVEVKEKTNSVSGLNSIYIIASGKVNYDGDIDAGIFQILAEQYGRVGDVFSSGKVLFNRETGDFSLGMYASSKPSTGHIVFVGREKDTRFLLTDTLKDVDFSAGAVTNQTLTLKKDADRGFMRVGLKYQHGEEISSISGSTINGYLPGDTYSASVYAQTDNYGYVYFLVANDTKFDSLRTSLSGVNSFLYKNATLKDVDGFFTDGQGDFRPNDLVINLEAAEPTAKVTISGSIEPSEGLEGVKVALRTQRDNELMTAEIVNGQYTFTDVPVFTKPNSAVLPLFLQAETSKYDETYKVTVPYNYVATPNKVTVNDGETSATQNLSVVKIACNVSGTVSPAKSGEVTLTKQGETKPDATYGYATVGAQGNYKFQGVPAGTYTLTVNCNGYKTATKEVTVANELADVTVDAITLEAGLLTVTVSGSLGATNPNNHKYVTFDGAKLSIWNSEGTEIAKTTMPEGANGWLQNDLQFQATIGMKVVFKMEHPSIKPVSKEYTVTGATLMINPSDLGYEFIDNTPDNNVTMTNFKAEWNTTLDSLKLSWTWPEGADHIVKTITLSRKLTGESGNGVTLKTWESETTFAANELPVAYTDTVSQTLNYTYMFDILYADLGRRQFIGVADMREGERYKLAYSVNDDKMGTLTSYSQPEGEYLEGDQITLTAKAKEGYKFVEFLKNGEKLSDAERAKLILYSDTAAIYGFSMPAEDVTVKAVFASRSGNETKEYTVTLKSSNEDWGTVSGAGKFEEGKEIEVKATVTDEAKYEFVAWKEGDKEVSKDATYKFKVEKDITLTAVFKEKVANENLKAARWAIFAEDGAIVIKGINGDRYDIYDLNGHHCGAALCTGAEIRLNVAKSKLYIVRRLGADGSFDAKKIVVR